MAVAQLYEPFSISVVPDRREVAVVLAGELDLMSASSLDREVRELRASGFGHIVVDLRRVTFVDSTGLRTLIGLNDHARADGYCVMLVPGPPAVQRIFDVTATRRLFDWRDS